MAARVNDVCGHRDRAHGAKGMCQPCYNTTPERREKHRLRSAAYRATSVGREKNRAASRLSVRKHSGIIFPDWMTEAELHTIEGECELCGKFTKRLHADHAHGRKNFRGFLCHPCNTHTVAAYDRLKAFGCAILPLTGNALAARLKAYCERKEWVRLEPLAEAAE